MIQSNVDLKPYNTFGVSVKAKYFVDVSSADQFAKLMEEPIFQSEEKLFVGGGSNMLLTHDRDGLVIHNSIDTKRIISLDDETMRVMIGGGVHWHEFVMRSVERGRWGIENLALIPGTVGAAPVQNIGAYGVEVADVIRSVKGWDLETGGIRALNRIECHFGYRDSAFKNELKGKFFITHVTFELTKKPTPRLEYRGLDDLQGQEGLTSLDIANKVIEVRQSKLPDWTTLGTAGSFFRNPIVTREVYEQLLGDYPDLVGWGMGDLEGNGRKWKEMEGTLPDGYEIRRATVDDVERIQEIRKQSWKETYTHLADEYIEDRFAKGWDFNVKLLKDSIEDKKHMYVLLYNDNIVGIKYWPREEAGFMKIGAIYILQDHHGKGLGTTLMKKSLSDYLDKDLTLEVQKDNTNAISFYEGLGFVIDDSIKQSHEIGTVWMQREGTPASHFKLSAGQLIELAGFPRGTRVGDVGNYEKHALVLVNHGDATGEQVWDLAQEIIAGVKEKFGVALVPEVNIL